MYTFDGLHYDCQGRGDFVLFKARDGDFMVQAQLAGNERYSFIRSVAVHAGAGAPILEMSSAGPFYGVIDGILTDLRTGYEDEFYLIHVIGHMHVLTAKQTGLLIRFGGNAFEASIPESFKAENIICGLLGTPDGDPSNDWTDQDCNPIPGGVPISAYDRRFEKAYQYSVSNWCISNEEDSLFNYTVQHATFEEVSFCNVGYGGGVDLSNVPTEVSDICGQDLACLIDGAELGLEGAQEIVEALPKPVPIPATPCSIALGQGNYYMAIHMPGITWPDAVATASSQEFCGVSGHLVAITSSEEEEIVQHAVSHCAGTGVNSAWIGLSDAATEGSFQWVTGEEFAYSNFCPGQPDNDGGAEDYTHLWAASGGCWNDHASRPNIPDDFKIVVEFENVPLECPALNDLQVCPDGVSVVPKAAGEVRAKNCCPGTRLCSKGAIFPFAGPTCVPDDHRCCSTGESVPAEDCCLPFNEEAECGDVCYDPKELHCCADGVTLVPKIDGDAVPENCCPGTTFCPEGTHIGPTCMPDDHKCCKTGESVPAEDCCLPHNEEAECAGECYDPNELSCCEDRVMHICCDPDESVCGNMCYDPSRFGCCDGGLTLYPQMFDLGGPGCCNTGSPVCGLAHARVCYDPTEFGCCDDTKIIFPRFFGESICFH